MKFTRNCLWEDSFLSSREGRLGEECVEGWLTALGWSCCERNMRFHGGEIDRVFVREHAHSVRMLDVCVAEIKTTRVRTVGQFHALFAEGKLRTLVRPHQLRNLWRTAAQFECRIRSRRRAQVRTYVRYFLVVIAPPRLIKKLSHEISASAGFLPVRLCCAGSNEVILSWSPDFPPQNL